MPLDYDFTEATSTATITFYIPPKYDGHPVIELRDRMTLVCNGSAILLYAPVSSLEIVSASNAKVEVLLHKETPGKWHSINSSRDHSHRRRDIPAEEIEQEAEDKPEGLMKLLTRIYANGNDDVKKAMNKSIEESGGTVLSTDWDAVNKKRVQPE